MLAQYSITFARRSCLTPASGLDAVGPHEMEPSTKPTGTPRMSAGAAPFVPGGVGRGVAAAAPAPPPHSQNDSAAPGSGGGGQAPRSRPPKPQPRAGRGKGAGRGRGRGRGRGGKTGHHRGRGGGGRQSTAKTAETAKAAARDRGTARAPASRDVSGGGGGGGGRRWNPGDPHQLLNFRLAEREQRPADSRPLHMRRARPVRSLKKQGFLHSNSATRLIVGEHDDDGGSAGGLGPCTQDADKPVPWAHVRQVQFQMASSYRCPICLEQPCCPRSTQCGHVFCWPCAAHYLSYGDDDEGRKCPICVEFIRLSDLRPAAIEQVTPPTAVGSTIDLVLLYRDGGSIFPRPVEAASAACADRAPAHGPADIPARSPWTKWSLADDVASIHAAERAQLERGLRAAVSAKELSVPFYEQCLHLLSLSERSAAAVAAAAPANAPPSSAAATAAAAAAAAASTPSAQPQPQPQSTLDGSRVESGGSTSVWSDDEDGAHDTEENDPRATTETSMSLLPGAEVSAKSETHSSSNKTTQRAFFFQSSDGQPVFLHPLELRCLLEQHGVIGMDTRIQLKVSECEKYTQDKATRKRFKFLSHLPELSEFWMVEADLKGLVSKATWAKFSEMFAARTQKRRQQRHSQRKREEKYSQMVARQSSNAAQGVPMHESQVFVPRDEGFLDDPFFAQSVAEPEAGGTSPPPMGSDSFVAVTKTHTVHQENKETDFPELGGASSSMSGGGGGGGMEVLGSMLPKKSSATTMSRGATRTSGPSFSPSAGCASSKWAARSIGVFSLRDAQPAAAEDEEGAAPPRQPQIFDLDMALAASAAKKAAKKSKKKKPIAAS
jgi:hypothetical protein